MRGGDDGCTVRGGGGGGDGYIELRGEIRGFMNIMYLLTYTYISIYLFRQRMRDHGCVWTRETAWVME